MAKILKCDDAVDIENVDEGVANKWRWQWVEKTVDVDLSKYPKITRSDIITICLKDCIRKIYQCGKCRKADPMKYETNGVATLMKHVHSFDHVQREVEKLTSYKILGSGAAKNIEENYVAPPMFSNTSSTSTSTTTTPQPTIHIIDCVCNMEAMVCAFLAEYSLSFSLAQPRIGMCKELSKDSAALKRLHMFRTTAKCSLLSFPFSFLNTSY